MSVTGKMAYTPGAIAKALGASTKQTHAGSDQKLASLFSKEFPVKVLYVHVQSMLLNIYIKTFK